MNWLHKLAPRHGWLDMAVLGGLLAAFNLVFSPRDFGWIQLNPTPWLLLPVLMGSRYGFTYGMAGAVVGILAMLIGLEQHGELFASVIFKQHGYRFAMMFIAGGFCGEIQRNFKKKEIHLTAESEHSRERLKKLDTDIFLLREAKGELERMLATRDAELSTLDAEIRRLFDTEGDEIYQDILLLLNRQARIADAAIYTLNSGSRELTRKGFIGNATSLPERMNLKKAEMIELAIRKKTTVTIPEFWETGNTSEKDYLIVVPLLDFTENPLAVLVVTGMPFISLTRKSVYLISLICRWAARVVEITHQLTNTTRFIGGIETQRIFTQEFFRQNLFLTLESWKKHSLPSAVVVFVLPKMPKTRQGQLESLIMPLIRSGDFPAELGLPIAHLAVLLPLAGERGTSIFVDRILNSCRRDTDIGGKIEARLISIEDMDNVDQLWTEIIRHVA